MGARGATGARGCDRCVGCGVLALALLCSRLWAQGRGGVASFPAQQRDPADPAVVARGRAIYDTECRSCHGADLRGGEQGGSNLLRVTLVLNDREGELIQPVLQAIAQGPHLGGWTLCGRHEGARGATFTASSRSRPDRARRRPDRHGSSRCSSATPPQVSDISRPSARAATR